MNTTKIAAFILALFSCLFFAGCQSPWNAVDGYQMSEMTMDYFHVKADRMILDDIQLFIRSRNILPADIGHWVEYGEDKNGRHAVFLSQEIPESQGMETKCYLLFYDKNNVRTKVKSWSGRRSC